MPPGPTDASRGDGRDETAQFITFKVGEEEYGVDIMRVREIKGWTETTSLPNSPAYMRGVLNLRGTIVPIYDLRARFGLGETAATSVHVIVIVAVRERLIGILVDAVSDILTVAIADIRAVPETERGLDQKFLSGLVSFERAHGRAARARAPVRSTRARRGDRDRRMTRPPAVPWTKPQVENS